MEVQPGNEFQNNPKKSEKSEKKKELSLGMRL